MVSVSFSTLIFRADGTILAHLDYYRANHPLNFTSLSPTILRQFHDISKLYSGNNKFKVGWL